MGYLHINNLYKDQTIMLFKECYALEKIHGTSAHISCKNGELHYFSGGENYNNFIAIFDKQFLELKFKEIGKDFIVYGEAYGGKCQGMSGTYGKQLKFVSFDVKIGELWLSVPQAEAFVKSLNLEFVSYTKISTDIDEIDKTKKLPSAQAKRNGILEDKIMEGIVLRPLIELTKNNGERIICKHKNDDFKETKTARVLTESEMKILGDAKKIAEEWVTEMRLSHVLQKFSHANVEETGNIIKAMIEDVLRESIGEIVVSKQAIKAISKMTAKMFKNRIKSQLNNN